MPIYFNGEIDFNEQIKLSFLIAYILTSVGKIELYAEEFLTKIKKPSFNKQTYFTHQKTARNVKKSLHAYFNDDTVFGFFTNHP